MSIFPFYDNRNNETNTRDMVTFADYAYDFDTNKLRYQNGKTYLVYKNDAIKIWVYKALATSRYRHLAYSPKFGSEHESLIGHVINDQVSYLELKRFITEALMCNPYIITLNNFIFTKDKSSVTVTFDITTIYGNIAHTQDFKEV